MSAWPSIGIWVWLSFVCPRKRVLPIRIVPEDVKAAQGIKNGYSRRLDSRTLERIVECNAEGMEPACRKGCPIWELRGNLRGRKEF
jgi:hypothetical protein